VAIGPGAGYGTHPGSAIVGQASVLWAGVWADRLAGHRAEVVRDLRRLGTSPGDDSAALSDGAESERSRVGTWNGRGFTGRPRLPWRSWPDVSGS